MTKYFSSWLVGGWVGWQGPPVILGQKVPTELGSLLGIKVMTLGFSAEILLGTAGG